MRADYNSTSVSLQREWGGAPPGVNARRRHRASKDNSGAEARQHTRWLAQRLDGEGRCEIGDCSLEAAGSRHTTSTTLLHCSTYYTYRHV